MEKWSVGIPYGLGWMHSAEAPNYDTQAEAERWLRDWLAGEPEPFRSGEIFTVRRVPATVPH